jgi:hypothetical protein
MSDVTNNDSHAADESGSRKPEWKFALGLISAAVWANSVQGPNGENRTVRSVTIQRRYFDRQDNTWKTATSFGVGDLPALKRVLTRAQQFLEDKEEQIPM